MSCLLPRRLDGTEDRQIEGADRKLCCQIRGVVIGSIDPNILMCLLGLPDHGRDHAFHDDRRTADAHCPCVTEAETVHLRLGPFVRNPRLPFAHRQRTQAQFVAAGGARPEGSVRRYAFKAMRTYANRWVAICPDALRLLSSRRSRQSQRKCRDVRDPISQRHVMRRGPDSIKFCQLTG